MQSCPSNTLTASFGNPVVAIDRAIIVAGMGLVLTGMLFFRGMSRLKGHFHDRHYRPIDSSRVAQTEHIGELTPATAEAVTVGSVSVMRVSNCAKITGACAVI